MIKRRKNTIAGMGNKVEETSESKTIKRWKIRQWGCLTSGKEKSQKKVTGAH